MEQVEHLPPQDLGLTERSEARERIAPRNAMGDNVTIQKNWQELIRPSKLQISPGGDSRRVATVVAEPLERHRPHADAGRLLHQLQREQQDRLLLRRQPSDLRG